MQGIFKTALKASSVKWKETLKAARSEYEVPSAASDNLKELGVGPWKFVFLHLIFCVQTKYHVYLSEHTKILLTKIQNIMSKFDYSAAPVLPLSLIHI